jgi:hypothetical protein
LEGRKMTKRILIAVVLGVAAGVGTGAWGASQAGPIPPDVWIHAGDSDGDGLLDTFEASHGLDSQKVDTFGDGVPDESRLAADGRTLWEVQEAEPNVGAAGGSGGGRHGGCGATGIEALLMLGVLHFILKMRRGV